MVRLDAKVTELGLTHEGSETGFLRKDALLPTDSVKNPVSLRVLAARNRVFTKILGCYPQIR